MPTRFATFQKMFVPMSNNTVCIRSSTMNIWSISGKIMTKHGQSYR